MEREIIENRKAVYTRVPPFPHNMLMEITNACNHRCAFCGYDHMQRPIGVADEQLRFRLLEEVLHL